MAAHPEKIIRDPVHDVIAFRMDSAEDALLFRLLNTVEFQRLRRVRQLGLTHLAYPGADHSRYSHCLGAMETARKMLDHLAQSYTIDPHDRLICLIAMLLHDLSHGPLSHVFERVSGLNHEHETQQLILDPDAQVHQVLTDFDPQLPQRVVDLMRCRPNTSFFGDILCSQLDADRFDYLLRDNLMTGSRYGDFDLTWLLHALTIGDDGRRLAVTFKGVSAVEAYLQSRYHMYRNVYFHKVVRSAEGMLKLVLQRGSRLAVQDRLPWPPRENTVYKSLLGQRLSVAEFADLDDISVLHCLKIWTTAEDPILARLCHGLLYRRLFKTIDLSHDSPEEAQRKVAIARQTIERAGGDGAYDLFYDEPADTPYETHAPDQSQAAAEILVLQPDSRLVPFAMISPMSQVLNQQLMFRRLHLAEAWKDRVTQAIEGH